MAPQSLDRILTEAVLIKREEWSRLLAFTLLTTPQHNFPSLLSFDGSHSGGGMLTTHRKMTIGRTTMDRMENKDHDEKEDGGRHNCRDKCTGSENCHIGGPLERQQQKKNDEVNEDSGKHLRRLSSPFGPWSFAKRHSQHRCSGNNSFP